MEWLQFPKMSDDYCIFNFCWSRDKSGDQQCVIRFCFTKMPCIIDDGVPFP